MMGWKPKEVREVTLADFDAAMEGFRKMHGSSDGIDYSDAAIADLEALMERYPDG